MCVGFITKKVDGQAAGELQLISGGALIESIKLKVTDCFPVAYVKALCGAYLS